MKYQPHSDLDNHIKKNLTFFGLFLIFCISVQELFSAIHNQLARQLIPIARMVKDCGFISGCTDGISMFNYSLIVIRLWGLMFPRLLTLNHVCLKLSNVVPRY